MPIGENGERHQGLGRSVTASARRRSGEGWEGGSGVVAGWLVESSFDSIFISRFNSISPQLSRSPGRRSASRIATRAMKGGGRGGGGGGGWRGRKIGKRAAGCSAGCRVQHWKPPSAILPCYLLPLPPPPSSSSHASPSRRGDKTSWCTEADPYTADPRRRRPSANLHSPRRRAARFQPSPPIYPPPPIRSRWQKVLRRLEKLSRRGRFWGGAGRSDGWFG